MYFCHNRLPNHMGRSQSHGLGWHESHIKILVQVFTCYGIPIEIVRNHGVHFLSNGIKFPLNEFLVLHWTSAPYHPQAKVRAQTRLFALHQVRLLRKIKFSRKKNFVVWYGLTDSVTKLQSIWHQWSYLWARCHPTYQVFDSYFESCLNFGIDETWVARWNQWARKTWGNQLEGYSGDVHWK